MLIRVDIKRKWIVQICMPSVTRPCQRTWPINLPLWEQSARCCLNHCWVGWKAALSQRHHGVSWGIFYVLFFFGGDFLRLAIEVSGCLVSNSDCSPIVLPKKSPLYHHFIIVYGVWVGPDMFSGSFLIQRCPQEQRCHTQDGEATRLGGCCSGHSHGFCSS